MSRESMPCHPAHDFADELAGRDTGAERPASRIETAASIAAGVLCGAALAGLLLLGASAIWKANADPLPPKRPAVEAGATTAKRPPVISGEAAPKSTARALAATVRVIDGDTIEVGGETIRLADIDTPERGARAECDAEARLAELATTRLRILLAEQAWRIERETKRDGTPKLDRYERSLAVLVLEPGGGSIGMVLVAEGYAVAWEGRRHDWCGSAAR